MKASMVKLAAAFLVIAAMAGCASTGGANTESFVHDLVYDPAYSIG